MSAQKRVGLGRGLGALIPTIENETRPASDEAVLSVAISDIQPNPRQPRTEFNEEELKDLSESILAHGIIQPLILTIDNETKKYFLIAGERRVLLHGSGPSFSFKSLTMVSMETCPP